MSAPTFCRFCNAENSIDEIGHVRASAWRKVESIDRGKDGKFKPKLGHVENDYADHSDFDSDGYRCCECQREEHRLEDLVGDPVVFEPGVRIVCPDGFKAVIATVDLERRRLTVEGWHEEFKFSEVEAVKAYAGIR